jgi:2-oxo-4-hydroxy-4-carboxy-5-ureidoimidazoline decarboxylase
MTGTTRDVSVDGFNALPEAEASRRLLTCLAVPRWATEVVEGRPYSDAAALFARAEQAASELSDAELHAALDRHPRIGERAGAGHDAEFSAREQGNVDHGDDAVITALATGNRAYEERFDRVFLICATGLSGEEILAALRSRLDNDDATEAAVVADELRKIALLRLERLLDS